MGIEDDINLYAYARGDVANLKDAGGTEVVLASGSTIKQRFQFAATLFRLSRSPKARSMLRTLQRSSNVYTVKVTSEDLEFKEKIGAGGTLILNPTQGLKLASGDVTSPDVGYAHEIAHAEHHETDPEGFQQQKSEREISVEITKEGSINVSISPGRHEQRAVDAENEVAADLGEAQRKGYSDGEMVTVPSSASHCEVKEGESSCIPK